MWNNVHNVYDEILCSWTLTVLQSIVRETSKTVKKECKCLGK